MGGYMPSPISKSVNVCDYVNFASTGSGQDFGDLIDQRSYVSACSDSAGGLGGF